MPAQTGHPNALAQPVAETSTHATQHALEMTSAVILWGLLGLGAPPKTQKHHTSTRQLHLKVRIPLQPWVLQAHAHWVIPQSFVVCAHINHIRQQWPSCFHEAKQLNECAHRGENREFTSKYASPCSLGCCRPMYMGSFLSASLSVPTSITQGSTLAG